MYVNITQSPRGILHEIALTAATLTVRRRATELMGQLVENRWPHCRRQSRETALKVLAADRKLAAKARLRAFEELMFPAEPTAEEKASMARIEAEAAAGEHVETGVEAAAE